MFKNSPIRMAWIKQLCCRGRPEQSCNFGGENNYWYIHIEVGYADRYGSDFSFDESKRFSGTAAVAEQPAVNYNLYETVAIQRTTGGGSCFGLASSSLAVLVSSTVVQCVAYVEQAYKTYKCMAKHTVGYTSVGVPNKVHRI